MDEILTTRRLTNLMQHICWLFDEGVWTSAGVFSLSLCPENLMPTGEIEIFYNKRFDNIFTYVKTEGLSGKQFYLSFMWKNDNSGNYLFEYTGIGTYDVSDCKKIQFKFIRAFRDRIVTPGDLRDLIKSVNGDPGEIIYYGNTYIAFKYDSKKYVQARWDSSKKMFVPDVYVTYDHIKKFFENVKHFDFNL